jgi:hypothetical protein
MSSVSDHEQRFEPKIIMKNIVLKFGLISGGIIAALMAISFLVLWNKIDFEVAEILGYVTMILAFSVIYVAIRQFRDQYQGGIIKFSKAFLIGFYISLICSVIYVITWMIISHYNPEIMEQMTEMYYNSIRNSDLSESEISEKLQQAEQWMEVYKNPFIKAGITLFEPLPVGIIISLISALILKRKSPKND